jgi:hypothetical protein
MSAAVTYVSMPGMFAMKDDYEVFGYLASDAYRPMSYQFGEPCEACWLADAGGDYIDNDWSDYDDSIYPVGEDGCPHGGAT